MARDNHSPSAGSTIVDKLKAYEGGTGQTTAAAALTALNAVPLASVGQPGGIAGLGPDKKLPASTLPVNSMSVVSIAGPATLTKGASATYQITNYDAFTAYTIAAVSGTLAVSGDTITYSAPANPGAGGFTINGRTFDVVISDFVPVTPTLTGVDATGPVLNATGSAYAVTGGTATHANSDWQVATDSAFSTIVSQSLADATNKTTWTSGQLTVSTTYYARVRYRDSAGNTSDFSNTLTFSTKSSYPISIEEAKIVPADAVAGNLIGDTVYLSDDGTRVMVGAANATVGSNTTQGTVYIFVRTGTTWAQEAKLVATSGVSGDLFGKALGMDSTATRATVAAGGYNSNAGAVYVFTRSGSTWTQEQRITSPNVLSNNNFGSSVSMSADGTRMIIGSRGENPASSTTGGVAYVFLRTGTTWASEQRLVAGDPSASAFFGDSVSINSDATRLVVTANGFTSYTGKCYVFLRTGTTWTQEAALQATDPASSSFFGSGVRMDSTGTRFVTGAYQANINGSNGKGCGYVFLRTGTSWTQEAKLIVDDYATLPGFSFRTVSMSGDGSRVVASGYYATVSTFTQAGQAYTFTRSGSTWSQDAKFNASDPATYIGFGWAVAISLDNSRVACGAPTTNGTNGKGAVYIKR